MGTEIDGKVHRAAAPSDKIPLSPDGFTTAQEVADLGTGGGQTLVIANDEDIAVAANPGETLVLYTAITDNREVSLPPATSASMLVTVRDVNGQLPAGKTIVLTANGTDTVQAPPIITSPNGVIALANDGVSEWFHLDASSSFPLGPFSDGTTTWQVSVGAQTMTLRATDNATGDKSEVLVEGFPGAPQINLHVVSGASTASFIVGANPATVAMLVDGIEYVSCGDIDALGLTLTDGGGGLFLRGTIPTSDPHVVGKAWRIGTALQVSLG